MTSISCNQDCGNPPLWIIMHGFVFCYIMLGFHVVTASNFKIIYTVLLSIALVQVLNIT